MAHAMMVLFSNGGNIRGQYAKKIPTSEKEYATIYIINGLPDPVAIPD